MLNKRQKIIMEFLDKDWFINKKAVFGCIYKYTENNIVRIRAIRNYDDIVHCKQNWHRIWQYHLWNLLHWFNERWYNYQNCWPEDCIIYLWKDYNTKDSIYCNLLVPPMEYNEEQSKELCSFMENILSHERR